MVYDKKYSDKKNELLGINFSTASARLKKSIFFSLVCRLELNVCYRCNEPINFENELSIEHKESWMLSDDPIGLFFDLDNIAFSHLSCNSGSYLRNKTSCSKGHEFTEDNTKIYKDGYRICIECQREQGRNHWHNDNRAEKRRIKRNNNAS